MNHHDPSFDDPSQDFDGLFQDNTFNLDPSNDVEDHVDNGIGGIPLQVDGERHHDLQLHAVASSSTEVIDPGPGMICSTDKAVEVAPGEIRSDFAGKSQLMPMFGDIELIFEFISGLENHPHIQENSFKKSDVEEIIENILESGDFQGLKVFKSNPCNNYLELHYIFPNKTTNIRKAMLIVYPECEHALKLDLANTPDHQCPSFPGPTRARESAKKLQAKTYHRGADNCKDLKFKTFRYDLTQKPPGVGPWLLLVLPYDGHNKRQSSGQARPAMAKPSQTPEDSLPDNLQERSLALVDEVIAALERDGRLLGAASGGGGSNREAFRSRMIGRLEALIRVCMSEGRKKPKWADHVYTPDYVRQTLDQIRLCIRDHGRLPWMRSQDEVEATGVDPARDLPDLLESVENMFLLVLDLHDDLAALRGDARDGGDSDARRGGQLDPASAEFLRHILIYAKAAPRARKPGAGDSDGRSKSADPAAVRKAVGEIMAQVRESTTSNERFKFYHKIVAALGLDRARDNALQAVALSVDDPPKAAGRFIQLYKNGSDPRQMLLLERYQDFCHARDSGQRADSEELTPRLYQEEMAAVAISRNTLLVAPTGCGKTKVVAMVLDDMWAKKPDAKAVFLAQSVQLVIQQAAALQRYCRPRADRRGVRVDAFGSFHKPKSWRDALAEDDVAVFTPQSLLNCLQGDGAPGNLRGVDLIVFDECHHSKKKHPFNQILQQFYHRLPPDQRPRVMGVTATVGGEMLEQKTLKRIAGFEERMDCRVFCRYQLSPAAGLELDQHKARLSMVEVPVPDDPLDAWFAQRALNLKMGLRGLLSDAKRARADAEKDMVKAYAQAVGQSILVAEDCGVHEALGWLAREFLCLTQRYGVRYDSESPGLGGGDTDIDDPKSDGIGGLLREIQKQFVGSSLFTDLSQEPKLDGSRLVSPGGLPKDLPTERHVAFANQLARLVDKGGEDQMSIIVFVRTRHGVKQTLLLLQGAHRHSGSAQLSELHRIYSRIRPRGLVGQGTHNITESIASQMETVRQFRAGICNVLVATSVAEEGLDFPECNAVIRLEGADSDVVLAQSAGRVRSDGDFVVIFKAGTAEEARLSQAAEKGDNVERALSLLPPGDGSGTRAFPTSSDCSSGETPVKSRTGDSQQDTSPDLSCQTLQQGSNQDLCTRVTKAAMLSAHRQPQGIVSLDSCLQPVHSFPMPALKWAGSEPGDGLFTLQHSAAADEDGETITISGKSDLADEVAGVTRTDSTMQLSAVLHCSSSGKAHSSVAQETLNADSSIVMHRATDVQIVPFRGQKKDVEYTAFAESLLDASNPERTCVRHRELQANKICETVASAAIDSEPATALRGLFSAVRTPSSSLPSPAADGRAVASSCTVSAITKDPHDTLDFEAYNTQGGLRMETNSAKPIIQPVKCTDSVATSCHGSVESVCGFPAVIQDRTIHSAGVAGLTTDLLLPAVTTQARSETGRLGEYHCNMASTQQLSLQQDAGESTNHQSKCCTEQQAQFQDVMDGPLANWGVECVCALFASCNFGQYAGTLREMGVDGKTLLTLTDEDLLLDAREGGLGMPRLQLRRLRAELAHIAAKG